MLTIRSKLVAAYTIVFGIVLVVFALVIYRSLRSATVEKLDARMESYADKVSTEIEEQVGGGVFPDPGAIAMLTASGLHDAALQIFDRNGVRILPEPEPVPLPEGTLRSVFAGHMVTENTRVGDEVDRERWTPVAINGRVAYAIRMLAPLADVQEEIERLEGLFLVVIPAALLVAALAALVITRAAFRPITTMIETARAISASDLSRRIAVPQSRDEVRLLAETLNDMMARIASAFKAQRQFVADASHEIRTPLTIIRTELEFGERSGEIDEVKESIRIALEETDHLASLAGSLLTLTRLESAEHPLDLHPIRLDEVVMRAVTRLTPLAQRTGIEIVPQIDDAIETVADGERLERALLNLIDNAIKYSSREGRVEVRLHRHGERAEMVVEDHGRGIEEKDLPSIFGRFHRADTARVKGEGHGLGLAIARKIAELHGGVLTAASTPEVITTFTLSLPLR